MTCRFVIEYPYFPRAILAANGYLFKYLSDLPFDSNWVKRYISGKVAQLEAWVVQWSGRVAVRMAVAKGSECGRKRVLSYLQSNYGTLNWPWNRNNGCWDPR